MRLLLRTWLVDSCHQFLLFRQIRETRAWLLGPRNYNLRARLVGVLRYCPRARLFGVRLYLLPRAAIWCPPLSTRIAFLDSSTLSAIRF